MRNVERLYTALDPASTGRSNPAPFNATRTAAKVFADVAGEPCPIWRVHPKSNALIEQVGSIPPGWEG